MKTKTLNDCKENIFSQYGEDGITREILKRLNVSSGICVEFGAWDGVALSNAAILWTNGWKGVLIESDSQKFETLKKVVADYDCIPLNKFVTPAGNQSLENILIDQNINFEDIKFICIDIDGNEYHILKGLTSLHPPIIVIEYNHTIPPELNIVSREDAFFGSSAKALVELADKKGYMIVAMTKNNCFFVDKKFKDLFTDVDTTFEGLADTTTLTYLITGYKGAYAFSQSPAFGMGLPLEKELIENGSLFFLKHSPIRIRWNYTKDAIKPILKRIIGVKNIERFRNLKSYTVWKMKKNPLMAHMLYKRKIFKKYKRLYNLDTFIETGTAGGGTVLALQKIFKNLYTIELDPTLYHRGKAETRQYDNIKCFEGDSGIVLKQILKDLKEPALFWLDAHYSGDGTARGVSDTPIVQELQSIFWHKIKKHVIVIDDMREFNGTNDYPTLSELKTIISSIAPEYKTSQSSDLLIIEPDVKN